MTNPNKKTRVASRKATIKHPEGSIKHKDLCFTHSLSRLTERYEVPSRIEATVIFLRHQRILELKASSYYLYPDLKDPEIKAIYRIEDITGIYYPIWSTKHKMIHTYLSSDQVTKDMGLNF